MSEQRILVGSTQTLVSYPRLNNGQLVMAQPTSCTVRIATPAVSMPSTYDNATVDTVSQTLSDNVNEGDISVFLSSAAAVVRGRDYIVTGAEGSTPPLLVRAENGGTITDVLIAEPIPTSVAITSTFKGFAVSHALTTAETDQPGNGLALWRAVVDSVTYEWAQSFRIVRRIPVCPLTPTRLTQAYPVIHTMRARTDTTLEELIATGWEFRVLRALEANGIAEENIVSTEVLEPLVAAGCLLQLVMQDPSLPSDYVDRVQQDYDRTMASVLGSRHWYETEQHENPSPRPNTEDPTPRRGAIGLTR